MSEPENESLVDVRPAAEGVVLMTLDRVHRRNALSVELREQGAAALADLASDESVRALVVTGAGEAFCSGFDLGEFERAGTDPAFAERLWASSDDWHRRWLEFPVPTIAAVNGAAIAGGFDLAVMCDLRVVARSAFFAHPEVSFGDVVYGPLHDLVGGAVARDLCFTGRRVDATEAAALGLVSRLVDDGAAVSGAIELAAAIAEAPRASLVRLKAKVVRRSGTVIGQTLDL
ncbi:MAG: enoyl-CoA hydratase/isomerase family protein [Acidimicrobiales bacterium]